MNSHQSILCNPTDVNERIRSKIDGLGTCNFVPRMIGYATWKRLTISILYIIVSNSNLRVVKY